MSKLIKVVSKKIYKKSYNYDFNVVLFNFIIVYYLLHIKSINNI